VIRRFPNGQMADLLGTTQSEDPGRPCRTRRPCSSYGENLAHKVGSKASPERTDANGPGLQHPVDGIDYMGVGTDRASGGHMRWPRTGAAGCDARRSGTTRARVGGRRSGQARGARRGCRQPPRFSHDKTVPRTALKGGRRLPRGVWGECTGPGYSHARQLNSERQRSRSDINCGPRPRARVGVSLVSGQV
jgi:hypothetical protein